MELILNSNPVFLLHQKAMYLPDTRTLVIADLHLGKAAHFRREGIALPAQAQTDDYSRLHKLIEQVAPVQVLFLGDLFHSALNDDWRNFAKLIMNFANVEFVLVRGNHDVIHQGLYKELDVFVTDYIVQNKLLFTHEPITNVPAGLLNIAGHVHPGFTLFGAGRQSAKLPCFYMHQQTMLLPAFGGLTGLYNMQARPDAQVFLVLSDEVRRWRK